MLRTGEVELNVNRRPITVSRRTTKGEVHNLVVSPGNALIDEHGHVRFFETHWEDGFVGHYLLTVRDDPSGDTMKAIATFFGNFGIALASGKLIASGNRRMNLGANQNVQSFMNYAFNKQLAAPIVSWVFDHIRPPTYLGYVNVTSGQLIYPGEAIINR